MVTSDNCRHATAPIKINAQAGIGVAGGRELQPPSYDGRQCLAAASAPKKIPSVRDVRRNSFRPPRAGSREASHRISSGLICSNDFGGPMIGCNSTYRPDLPNCEVMPTRGLGAGLRHDIDKYARRLRRMLSRAGNAFCRAKKISQVAGSHWL